MTAAAPVPISPHAKPQSNRATQGEAVQAIAGLGLAALDALVAAVLSRRFSVNPARIAEALRPTTEELVLLGPLVAVVLAGLSPKARLRLALVVLGVWFGSRIVLAAQAGAFARTTTAQLASAPTPAGEPTPPQKSEEVKENGTATEETN